jgi:uncharacterized protein
MLIRVRGLYIAKIVFLLSVFNLSANAADVGLIDAVKAGDREAVRSLLRQHTDVNKPLPDGATALHWAVHRDDLQTVDLLIAGGAKVNAVDEYGVTPVSLACTNGNAAMVEKLLTVGADPNVSMLSGETPLMTCAGAGSVKAVTLLLAEGADVNAKDARAQQTALMWAVAEKHPDVAKVLIEHGADVRARSRRGFTPLLFAAQQGDIETARVLLAAGADLNEATPTQEGAAKGRYGADSDPAQGGGGGGVTPLLMAAASSHEELAIFLVDKGADANAADSCGTALHYAMRRGIVAINRYGYELPNMLELTKALLAHGANPNARLKKNPWTCPDGGNTLVSIVGATPLWLAAAGADVAAMRILLDSGADPLLTTEFNITPLMAATGVGQSVDRPAEAEKNALEAVKLLVAMGSDLDAANRDSETAGLTALHGAARLGSNAMIQFLVEKGANINAKDKYGQTPLSLAEGWIPPTLLTFNFKSFGPHPPTADLLRKLGAAPTPTDGR